MAEKTTPDWCTDEEFRIMVRYVGGDPRVPRTVCEEVFCEYGSEDWTLPDFLRKIEEAVSKIPEECRPTATVELSGGYDEFTNFEIYYERQETESEVSERVSSAIAYARETLSRERATYEQLRRKYGVDDG